MHLPALPIVTTRSLTRRLSLSQDMGHLLLFYLFSRVSSCCLRAMIALAASALGGAAFFLPNKFCAEQKQNTLLILAQIKNN